MMLANVRMCRKVLGPSRVILVSSLEVCLFFEQTG
jgi:hypothetical protein